MLIVIVQLEGNVRLYAIFEEAKEEGDLEVILDFMDSEKDVSDHLLAIHDYHIVMGLLVTRDDLVFQIVRFHFSEIVEI